MPRPQQPYPTPLAVPGRHVRRLILRRNLVQEMDDLSDEEAELEDSVRCPRPLFLFGFILMVVLKQTLEVKNRGYGFLIPIGKILTQHEEKNDVRIFFLFQPVCAACDSTRRIGLLNLRSSPLLFDNWCSLGSQPT